MTSELGVTQMQSHLHKAHPKSAPLSSLSDLQASLRSKTLFSAGQSPLPAVLCCFHSLGKGLCGSCLSLISPHLPPLDGIFHFGEHGRTKQRQINFTLKNFFQIPLWKFWIHWKSEIQKDSIKKENEVGRHA